MRRVKAEERKLNEAIAKGELLGVYFYPMKPRNWRVVLEGPLGSPYQNGIFEVDVNFPEAYPFKAARLILITKMWHTGVNFRNGEFCLEKTCKWKPVYQVIDLIKDIKEMMASPEIDLCNNVEASNQLLRNIEEFKKKAKEWTEKYAIN